MQVQALAAWDGKGHGTPPVTGDPEAPLIRKLRQVIHHVRVRPDLTGSHSSLEMIDKTDTGVQCRVETRPAHLGPALHQRVRCTEDPAAAGVAGIRPAEAMVDQILQRLPMAQRALRRTRWMGIVAHAPSVGTIDHARDGKIDLQAPRMGVGRGIEGRTRAGRDTGPCELEGQAQGQVHLPPQDRVTGIEGCRVDVIGREGQHEAYVSVREGQRGQSLAQSISATEQDLRRGIARSRLALGAALLHHHRRIHISREGAETIVPSLIRPTTVMREADQHSRSLPLRSGPKISSAPPSAVAA